MYTPRIGVLGGGQLGRMLLRPAMNLNLWLAFMDSDPQAPCHAFAPRFVQGDLQSREDILAFGQDLDLLTVEIENVNTSALEELEAMGKKVYPQPQVLSLIQDKGRQKAFYTEYKLPTAPYRLIENRAELIALKPKLPAVLKLRTGGYDGRGVQILRREGDLAKAFDAPCVLEELVDIEREVAVMVARSPKGEVKSYPSVESAFHPEANIVEFIFTPSGLTPAQEADAQALARMVIERLDMVGILGVEFFLDKAGNLLINEMAPRPHNSGHASIEGNETSQFEQHLRALLNYPLGSTRLLQPTVMVNLLGEEGHEGPAFYENLKQVLALEGAHIHLYGKTETRYMRKMGHVTLCDKNVQRLHEKALWVKDTLKVITK